MPEIEEINIRSEEVQEILTAVPNWMIRWGNTVVLVFILGLFAISWFVSYPDVIASPGIITTVNPPQKLYAQIPGKIDTLLVVQNELVLPHTPIAIIENTANYEDVLFLKSIIDTLKPSKEKFVFPIDKIPFLFLGDIETSYANFENTYQAYSLNNTLKPYANESIANSAAISQLNFRLKNAKAKKSLNASELELRRSERDRAQTLFDKGVIAQQEFETTQAAFLQAENAYASNDAQISQTLEGISNARKISVGTRISGAKEAITLLKNVHQSFNQLKKEIKNWEQKYVLQSDIKGRVTFLDFWSANQTVKQGDLMFTLIPFNNSSYIARLKTPAQNSGKIKTGQKVQLSLQDFPDNEYGVLRGEINRISAVTNEEGNYIIEVTLPSKLVTSYKKEIQFKQEMTANAKIITEDLRLIERFFYQLKNLFNN